MRLGIQVCQKIVEAAHERVGARRHPVQRRIFQFEISLAHCAFHFCNRVTHHAAESRLSSRSVFHLANGMVEHAAEKQRRIVAARAPLRGFHAHGVLHVFDALAVPRIVERGKMMRRALPFFVDVRVAPLARSGLRKIIRGNLPAVGRLRGARKERAARPIAFAVHRSRRHRGIFDAVCAFPGNCAQPPRARNSQTRGDQEHGAAQEPCRESSRQKSALAGPARGQQRAARSARADMRV